MVKCAKIKEQFGFSYLALLMIMSVTSIGMAAVGAIWSFEAQRQKEKELLFVGNAYAAAIKSYYISQPHAKLYPKAIEDLIEDKRGVKIKRHLRKTYSDPMTRDGEWELLKQGDFIIGVRSQSPKKIINKALFSTKSSKDEVVKYADIIFAHAASQTSVNNTNKNTADFNRTEHTSVNTQTEPESTSDFQLHPRAQKILDEYNAWIENELDRMRKAIKQK